MFKAIRNLVRQRSRDGHQDQPQVIEEDNSREPRSDPDVPPELAEPQLGEPPAPTVWGKVKWYMLLRGTASSSSRTGPATLFSMLLRLPA